MAPRPNLCLGVLAPLRLDSEAAKRKDVGPGVGEEGAVGGSVRIGPLRTNEVGIGIGSPGSSEDWVSCRPNLFKFPLTNLLVSRQTSSPIRASRLPLRRPFILFPRPKSDQTKAAIFKSVSSPFRSSPVAFWRLDLRENERAQDWVARRGQTSFRLVFTTHLARILGGWHQKSPS